MPIPTPIELDPNETIEIILRWRGGWGITSIIDGWLLHLTHNYAYQQYGSVTVPQVGDIMREMYNCLLDKEPVMPVGTIIDYAGDSIPAGYLLCDGASYLASDYPKLAAIGGLISVQPGGYIRVPDLRRRVVIGGEDPAGGTPYPYGGTGGTATHTLTSTEMPAHTHTQQAHSHQQYGLNVYPIQTGNVSARLQDDVTLSPTSSTTAVNQATGGGAAHNNMQPYMALHKLIRAK